MPPRVRNHEVRGIGEGEDLVKEKGSLSQERDELQHILKMRELLKPTDDINGKGL